VVQSQESRQFRSSTSGVFIASWCQTRYGYVRTIQISLVWITGAIFCVFFAPNVQILFLGEVLCGLPWGAFSSSAVSYASEVTPVALRGYMTTYANMCWIIGQIISSGVVLAVTPRTDQWSYRICFALQWMWPVPLFILMTLAPESPWFLVRTGRHKEAERSIQRLSSKGSNVNPPQVIALMVRTNQIELETSSGVSYWVSTIHRHK
jgi:SP family general alpha glucoside:H+ symporter-like MFS transporter